MFAAGACDAVSVANQVSRRYRTDAAAAGWERVRFPDRSRNEGPAWTEVDQAAEISRRQPIAEYPKKV